MAIAQRSHPIPSRTRPLSSVASMVLHVDCGRVDRRQSFFLPVFPKGVRAFFLENFEKLSIYGLKSSSYVGGERVFVRRLNRFHGFFIFILRTV